MLLSIKNKIILVLSLTLAAVLAVMGFLFRKPKDATNTEEVVNAKSEVKFAAIEKETEKEISESKEEMKKGKRSHFESGI